MGGHTAVECMVRLLPVPPAIMVPSTSVHKAYNHLVIVPVVCSAAVGVSSSLLEQLEQAQQQADEAERPGCHDVGFTICDSETMM